MRKLLAGLAGILLLALLAPATPARAAAPPGTNLQLMSWNMCGAQRETWGCTTYGTPADKIGVIVHHVETNYVQAMLLQEICQNDLNALMSRLGGGWSRSFEPYRYSSDGVLTVTRCGDGAISTRTDPLGTAIVIKAGMTNAQVVPTTQPWNGLHRPVQCATATYFDNIRLCNAHLTPVRGNPEHPEWEYGDDQLRELKAVVDSYDRVAFGGDLNVLPPDWAGDRSRAWLWPADLYWNGTGTPGYRECDQPDATRTGRSTTVWGGKIDYVFSTQPRRWCSVGLSGYSDHAVVISSMQIA